MRQRATTSIFRVSCVLQRWHKIQALLILLLKVSLNLVSQLLSIFSRDYTFRDELLLILLRWSRNLSDLFVHDRLSEAWLVYLVVAVVAIPDHIKHHILAVLAPVLNSEAARSDYSLWIRGVHPQNWYFKWLDEIR